MVPDPAEPTSDDTAEAAAPDIDALVDELRAKVKARRQAGEYPPGMEDDLDDHFRRVAARRVEPLRPVDVRGPVEAVGRALPLERERITAASEVPGGAVLHQAVARVVGRQTQGVLEQVQAFAEPARIAIEALATAVEELRRVVTDDLAVQLAAVLDRQAAQERAIAQGAPVATTPRAAGDETAARFNPWYSSERFESRFRGSREELLDRYRDIVAHLEGGGGPVFEIGFGRGEVLELLGQAGVPAWGVDLDPDLVKAASALGLAVEEGDGLATLRRLDDASLGGVVAVQVVEHLSAQGVADLAALAATKVRPGGRVLLETVNPQSLYVYAHSFWLDPTHLRPVHPAYLTFLFEEAGFASVAIEWRSPPPPGDVLEEVDANAARLNRLLFAPQDYLLVATR